MIEEIIWILIIIAIVACAVKGVNDFNKMVDIGVAKLAEKEDNRWRPASELLNEMDKEQQTLQEQNREEESDDGDDDAVMVGL